MLHFDIEHSLRMRVKKTEKARFVKFLRAYGEYVLLRAEYSDLEAGLSDGLDKLDELLAAASALDLLTKPSKKPAIPSDHMLGVSSDLQHLVDPCVDAVRDDLKQMQQLLKRQAKVRIAHCECGCCLGTKTNSPENVQHDTDAAELLRKYQHLFPKQQATKVPTKRPSLQKPAAKRRSS